MNKLLHSHTLLLVRRIALLYGVLMLCRVVFYCYNAALLGPLSWDEMGSLLAGALKFDTVSVVYADGIFILLSLLPMYLREREWYNNLLFGYYMIVNTLVVGLNIADAIYFHYTQKRLTADEVFFADNGNSLQLIGKFAAENWYLMLIGAFLVLLLMWGYGRRIRTQNLLQRGWIYYAGNTTVFVAAGLLCVVGMRGGMTRMTRPVTLSNATLYTPDSSKANLILSNPFCILRTIGSGGTVRYERYFSDEELPRRFTPCHIPPDSVVYNLAGRNMMIFIMESMSAEHSAHLKPELWAGKEPAGVTPFLDSLMQSGLCFERMYANGYRSIQAMPAVLGSIPSFKTPFVLMPQSLGRSRQLPAILRDRGYETAFFCGSERGSMGFGAYARSAGVDRLISREDYEAVHGTEDFDGYWGIWDEPFLQFTGEKLSQMPQPFVAALFTLSSHHPFVVPEKYRESLPKGFTAIHQGVAYDDLAFRRFFERFGKEAWFRNTIFVFVADHVSSEKFAPETASYPENSHIISFVYTPDGALQGQIQQITQQIDLMPTLLGILGNQEPYFAFGRDVFNEPARPQWALSYEGQFRALTDQGILQFDDEQDTIIPFSMASDSLAQNLRGLVQQYYFHIESKDYTCHD